MNLWHFLRFGSFIHDFHAGRDPQGRLIDVCTSCGYARVVLGEAIVIGPAHRQKADLGSVKTKAYPERSVTKIMKRRSA